MNNSQTNPVKETIAESLVKKCDKKRTGDSIVKYIFFLIAAICSTVIIFVVIFLLIKGLSPFLKDYVFVSDGKSYTTREDWNTFFFSTTFSQGEKFGVAYLMLNTLYASLLSMVIAIPLSILTALLITRIAPRALSKIFQTGIELLSSIPSVIYGLFGAGYITTVVKSWGNAWGIQTAGGASLLAGVFVLAIMSLPTITLMSCTAIKAVDPSLIKASLALGASKSQTNFKIVLKDAQSGIFAGIILGLGRALGEATAIQMVIGNAGGWDLTNTSTALNSILNPFNTSSTLTTQMLMGLGEATPGTLAYDIRFSAGILLILMILIFDLSLNSIKNRIYAKQMGRVKESKFKKFIKGLFPAKRELGLNDNKEEK